MEPAELGRHLRRGLEAECDLLIGRQGHALLFSGDRVNLRVAEVVRRADRGDDQGDEYPAAPHGFLPPSPASIRPFCVS
jgi:hypothetical protein